MRALATINSAEMRAINRSAVLEVIRSSGPVSRSVIAATLKISLPTVMRIVDELLQEGLACASGVTEWSGGRRRPLIGLNVSGQVVVGVDLGGSALYGAVADLGGAVLHEVNRPASGKGETACLHLAEVLAELLSWTEAAGVRVLGLGAGVPGVCAAGGLVLRADWLDWQDYPLLERLEQVFPERRIEVENNARLGALGELWFGDQRNVDSLALILADPEIQAGFVLGGALYDGAFGAAGELNWLSGEGEAPLDRLVAAVAAVQAVLDPQVILLGTAGASDLLGPAQERLRGRAVLRASSLGRRAVVLGIIARLMLQANPRYSVQASG